MKLVHLDLKPNKSSVKTLADGRMGLAHTTVRDGEVVDDFQLNVRTDDGSTYEVTLSTEEIEEACNWFNQQLINYRGRGIPINMNNLGE